MKQLANGYISNLFNSALKKQVDGVINDILAPQWYKDISIVNLISVSGERGKTA